MQPFFTYLSDRNFNSAVAIGCFGAILLSYAFQAIVPVFNADDIYLAQLSTKEMIAQGRWLYSIIYHGLLGANPTPVVSTAIGCVFLFLASYLQALVIGLATRGAVAAFILIASISIFYQFLFSFDSTRLAYPLANLLISAGLALSLFSKGPRGWLVAVLLVALAPAVYPAALMLGLTTILAAALAGLNSQGCWSKTYENPARMIAVMVAGGIAYVIMTKGLYWVIGWELTSDRTELNLRAIVDNWHDITEKFFQYSAPLIYPFQNHYFPGVYFYHTYALIGAFLLMVVVKGNRARPAAKFLAALAIVALLQVAPYCLIFITEMSYYPERALYSFAAAYAALGAIPLDCLLRQAEYSRLDKLAAVAILLLLSSFLILNMMLISQRSFDEYLAWEQDKATVIRILARIDDVVGDRLPPQVSGQPVKPVPIAVFGKYYWQSGPRGQVAGALSQKWSKETAFSLFDRRFERATNEQRDRVKSLAAQRPPWPAQGSVFMENGVVVVVIGAGEPQD